MREKLLFSDVFVFFVNQEFISVGNFSKLKIIDNSLKFRKK